jgi:hypothetical protein
MKTLHINAQRGGKKLKRVMLQTGAKDRPHTSSFHESGGPEADKLRPKKQHYEFDRGPILHPGAKGNPEVTYEGSKRGWAYAPWSCMERFNTPRHVR